MGGMGTSTQSSTEHSQTSYPQWSQDAMQNTYSTGAGMMENFLRNPQYAVAGMNTDQMKGMDLARDSARNIFGASAGSAPSFVNLNPVNANAATVDASMNPFLKNVVDTTRETMQRDWRDKDASLAASSAASAVRGSGGALARGQLARGAQENIGNVTSQLMAQGYDKAKAMELANAQMQQQANITNAGAANSMLTTGADYGLKATQVNDSLRTAQQARELAAIQQIMQGGNQQQKFAQSALDVPWTMLQMLMALSPKQLNSTTNSQKQGESTASPADTFKSVAGGLGTLAGIFSDENEKTNIQKLGKDPETGLPIYAYDYKADVEAADKSGRPMPPKRVGPMAQDIEKKHPDAIVEIDGKKAVAPGLLALLLSKKAA